jgi:predicted phosphodiesterase
MLDDSIKQFIKDNIFKSPAELNEEIFGRFKVDVPYKQISNYKYYFSKAKTPGKVGRPAKHLSKTKEIDGTIISENVPITPKDLSSLDSILEVHKIDSTLFEITQMWSKQSDNGLILSSVCARPKRNFMDNKSILKELKKDIKPIKLNYTTGKSDYNYLINIADIHMGISTLKDIEPTLNNISKYFDTQKNIGKIYINLLGDEFHSCQFSASQTLKGTVLNEVDTIKAWSDLFSWFKTLFEKVLSGRSKNISLYRTPGNHDANLSYCFANLLQIAYPNINIFNTNNERTYYRVEDVGIMLSHGNKGKLEDLFDCFINEGRKNYSQEGANIILTGHRHQERIVQRGRATVYQVGTNKPIDKWESQQAYSKDNRKLNWNIIQLSSNDIEGIKYI